MVSNLVSSSKMGAGAEGYTKTSAQLQFLGIYIILLNENNCNFPKSPRLETFRGHWDSVHKPDPRLVLWSSSSGFSSLYWRFCVGAVGGGWMYAYSRSWCCNDKTLPDACYPRILLMLDQGVRHGPQGASTLYIHSLCQWLGCEYGNQLYLSFGLDDRYLILIVTTCYRDI